MRAAALALIFLATALPSAESVIAQQPPAPAIGSNDDLQRQKLQLEIEGLQNRRSDPSPWIPAIASFFLGVGGAGITLLVGRWARRNELDKMLHDKRIASYVTAMHATEPLALFFPPSKTLVPADFATMGQALRRWYFSEGGLLMSQQARDAYFRFARALTPASLATRLNMPSFPEDALAVGDENVHEYRKAFGDHELDDVAHWAFGTSAATAENPALRFKDYVFLQRLSSQLRTQLCADLHSRRRPA